MLYDMMVQKDERALEVALGSIKDASKVKDICKKIGN